MRALSMIVFICIQEFDNSGAKIGNFWERMEGGIEGSW
jgi:hypothetical protein